MWKLGFSIASLTKPRWPFHLDLMDVHLLAPHWVLLTINLGSNRRHWQSMRAHWKRRSHLVQVPDSGHSNEFPNRFDYFESRPSLSFSLRPNQKTVDMIGMAQIFGFNHRFTTQCFRFHTRTDLFDCSFNFPYSLLIGINGYRSEQSMEGLNGRCLQR